MNIRKIFIVVAKIIGLYQSFDAFNRVAYGCVDADKASIFAGLLLLALAYALVFKTAWLADKAGLAENKNDE